MGGEYYLEVDALRKPGASGVQLSEEFRGESDVDQGVGGASERGAEAGNMFSIKLRCFW